MWNSLFTLLKICCTRWVTPLSLRFTLPLSLGLSTTWLYCVTMSISWVTPFWSSSTISSMWSHPLLEVLNHSFLYIFFIVFPSLFSFRNCHPAYVCPPDGVLHNTLPGVTICLFFFPFYSPVWVTSFFLSSCSQMLSSTCSDVLRNRPSKLLFSLPILQLQIFFNPV